MSDNTIISAQTGGDTIRDLARQSGSVKTQVFQLDVGGPSANAENLITVGQQTKAGGIPVTLSSDVTASVTVTPTVTAAAYSTGNEVGGLLTFTSAVGAALGGIVQSIAVTSKSIQTTGLKLYLFSANPSNSTWTDKSTPAINVADLPGLLGSYTLGSADSGLGTMTVWNLDGISKSFRSTTTSLYGVLVAVGTPTFASTSDVSVTVSVLND